MNKIDNLHYAKLLNKTLLYIKEHSAISEGEPHTVGWEEIPEGLRLQLFRYLENEGYTFHENFDKESGGKTERLYVSIRGLAFLEKGGFVNQYNAERAKYIWNRAKTIAAVANALMIILVAIYAVHVSDKTNVQDAQIKAYEDSIIKLNRLIK